MRRTGNRVIAAPRARGEVREIVRWYQRANPRAAIGFRASFKEALAVLAEAPPRWAEVTSGLRRYLLPRYPYTLMYVVEDGRVIVLSVLHQARHPDTWRRDR